MRRIALIGLVLATTASAAPLDGADITQAALRCWNPPPTTDVSNFKATFLIAISRGQAAGIDVTEYRPQTPDGKEAVRSASLAIERCAPYSLDDGSYSVQFPGDASGNTPIDPFKE